MRMLLVSGMFAIGAGLAGCACMSQNGSYTGEPPIAINYASDGTPSATPDPYSVAGGSLVTWQGAVDDSRPFTIEFEHGSPSGDEERASLSSAAGNSRQTVTLRVKSVRVETDLKYSIIANGKREDPHIIIKPANN